LFEDLLTDEGYRVTTQAYLDKDLNKIAEMAPDLIIIDYMWPGDDAGWSLLQMLKMDRRRVAIPAILCMAAVKDVEMLTRHLGTLQIRVVYKPFDIDTLLQAVGEVLAEDSSPV
jgi:CheY-like chemotaxis protein